MFRPYDPDWSADLARVGARASLWKEQSLWAIWVYRYGHRVERRADGFRKRLEKRWYWMLFRLVETITGISIPNDCVIGPGLRIWHFGGIFLHPKTVIGRNCTLRQGVTIGNRWSDDRAPVVGNDVEIGAYAQIIGPVHIGDGCRIGALTAVLADLPPGAVAVGQAARILSKTENFHGND